MSQYLNISMSQCLNVSMTQYKETQYQEREREFLVGAPLAIVPALVFLPAVMFLIVFPRVAHGRALGVFVVLRVLPGVVCGLVATKLLVCGVGRGFAPAPAGQSPATTHSFLVAITR